MPSQHLNQHLPDLVLLENQDWHFNCNWPEYNLRNNTDICSYSRRFHRKSLAYKKKMRIDNVISIRHDKVQIRLVSCTKKWVVNIHKTPEYTITLSGHYLAKHLGYSIHRFPEHDPWQTLNAEGGPISRYLVTRKALISIDLIKNLNIYIKSVGRYRLINC